MSVSSFIKAPLGVQLNRAAFLLYAILFSWPLWYFRQVISVGGLLIFYSFVFCSLLGLGYSFIRISRSRWILAVLDLVIPGVFWTLMLREFSRPTAWWEWVLDTVVALGMWFGFPIMLATSLFWDRKTREYFTKHAAVNLPQDS
jgi:hypothetical protein